MNWSAEIKIFVSCFWVLFFVFVGIFLFNRNLEKKVYRLRLAEESLRREAELIPDAYLKRLYGIVSSSFKELMYFPGYENDSIAVDGKEVKYFEKRGWVKILRPNEAKGNGCEFYLIPYEDFKTKMLEDEYRSTFFECFRDKFNLGNRDKFMKVVIDHAVNGGVYQQIRDSLLMVSRKFTNDRYEILEQFIDGRTYNSTIQYTLLVIFFLAYPMRAIYFLYLNRIRFQFILREINAELIFVATLKLSLLVLLAFSLVDYFEFNLSQLTKSAIFISCVLFAFRDYRIGNYLSVLFSLVLMIVFNPFFPINMEHTDWKLIATGAIYYMCIWISWEVAYWIFRIIRNRQKEENSNQEQ